MADYRHDIKRDKLALCVAAGMSQGKAAKAAGYSVATVGRLLKDKSFQARVREHVRRINRDLVRRVTAQLAKTVVDVVPQELKRIIESPDEKGYVKVGAMRVALESLLRWVEHGDLSDRVDGIEESLRALAEQRGAGSALVIGSGASASLPGGNGGDPVPVEVKVVSEEPSGEVDEEGSEL